MERNHPFSLLKFVCSCGVIDDAGRKSLSDDVRRDEDNN
jgi:hypothetical protein